jgi:hypothetical protein
MNEAVRPGNDASFHQARRKAISQSAPMATLLQLGLDHAIRKRQNNEMCNL